MQGKIALEEHFAIAATLDDSKVFGAHVWEELGPRLTDFHDTRLRLMDASGVELMIASLSRGLSPRHGPHGKIKLISWGQSSAHTDRDAQRSHCSRSRRPGR